MLEEFKTIIGIDKWIFIYLIFAAFDFITGFLKAWKVEGFKSRKLRDGIVRLIAEIIAIVFTGILDFALGLSILMVSTKMLFIFKEAISIIENLGILGVDFPQIVKDKIQDLKPEEDKKEE